MSSELNFSNCVLRMHERQLLCGGQQVALGARAFDVLCALALRPGQLVSKAELFDQVWPGMVVEENNLQVHVSTLRKLIGPDLIVTVPGRGYRFTGHTSTLEKPESPDLHAVQTAPTVLASFAAVTPTPATSPTTSPTTTPAASLAALPSATSARSIAVLPFANLSNDPEQEYFSDGLAEDIISKLTRSSWLYVIARNSSFAYRQPSTPSSTKEVSSPGEICRALGARYLVTGTVRRSGNTMRITAELADAQQHETLWSQRFDRPLDNLFEVQNAISTSIVSAIEPVYLRREEFLTSQFDTPNMQHWELLMRARWHFWRSSRDHNEKARTCLTQALVTHSDDPACLALMSFTHMARVWAGWSQDARGEILEANRLALRAVRQDDTDSFAHFTLGTALSLTGNLPQAIAELEYAITLYPQFAGAAGELGRLLAFSGQTDDAMEYVLQAIDASPHDPHLSLWVRTRAIAYFIEGDYTQAARYAQEATAKRSDWFFNYYLLAACQAAAGNLAAAQKALQHGQAFGPYSLNALRMGHPFAQPDMAEKFVGFLQQAGWEG